MKIVRISTQLVEHQIVEMENADGDIACFIRHSPTDWEQYDEERDCYFQVDAEELEELYTWTR